MLENNPTFILLIYEHAHEEFDVAIKERSSMAPDPDKSLDVATRSQGQDPLLCPQTLHSQVVCRTLGRHQNIGTEASEY